MATFGNTNIEATAAGLTQDFTRCTRFTLTENGDVTKITIYGKRAAANQHVTAGIYSVDTADTPDSAGALLGVTEEVALPESDAWYDLNFSPSIALSAGDYWLAFGVDTNAGGAPTFYRSNGAADKHGIFADTYSDGFATTGGAWINYTTFDQYLYSIYATYTPSGESAVVRASVFGDEGLTY
jgi:hypothetical protein